MSIKKGLLYGLLGLSVVVAQIFVGQETLPGKPPEITGHILNDKTPLSRRLPGPSIIYFWASWCGVCRSMQDTMNKVLREYPGVTLAVKSGAAGEVLGYLEKSSLDWPVVVDDDADVAGKFGIRGVPAVFILDREGKVKYATMGYTTEWGMRVRLWLAERSG
ncbi:MAG: redoxin domain-containing protein [Gammaproteobacteria bacterium]